MRYIFFVEERLSFSFSALREEKWREADLPDYAVEVVRWVTAWLQGEEHVTLQTSGSMGSPQPMMLHRSQLEVSARLGMEVFGVPRVLPLVGCLSVRHIAGVMQLVRALTYGHAVHVLRPARDCLRGLERGRRYGLVALVPLQVQAALRGGYLSALEQFHTVVVGGAALFPSTEQALEGLGTRVYHSYGLTESVAHVALRRLHRPARAYFEALPGVQLRRNQQGCLHIRTPATKYQDIHTQDLVEMKGRGRFLWLGRADAVINSGGVTLYLDELDRQIGDCWLQSGAGSGSYFAYGLPDDELGERLVWFVEHLPAPEVCARFKANLGKLIAYHRPKSICVSEAFVLTRSAKVDKKSTLGSAFREIGL